MLEGSMTEQDITLCEGGNDVVIGLENMLPGKNRRVGVIHPVTPHRVIHFQSVAATHLKVFKAMGGRSMHTPGACLGGDVLTEHDGYRVGAKRWRYQQSLQLAPLGATHNLERLTAKALRTRLRQRLCDEDTTTRHRQKHIIQLCRERHAAVSGQRPWCGRPYRQLNVTTLTTAQSTGSLGLINKEERHIHGG